jgi:DNA-binding response OmpR family regulator
MDVMMKWTVWKLVKTSENSGVRNVIIAFLTARSEDYSQVAGFDAGADDYIKTYKA